MALNKLIHSSSVLAGNKTWTGLPPEKTVHALFEQAARKHPYVTALSMTLGRKRVDISYVRPAHL